jgi:phage terminase large subunit-like protein
VEAHPHVHLYRLWEAPEGARDWRVPIVQVEDAVRAACVRQLVVDGELNHDGDPALARHLANTILKTDSRGARLAKEHKDSKRRIDAAVCAVMAVHRAAELADSTPAIYA